MDGSHRDLCHYTTRWLLDRPRIDMACWELSYGKSIVDAIAVSTKDQKILVAECKRTRSDLLSELRTKKLLKYESRTTHCYIAATGEALKLGDLSVTEAIADLTDRGLPNYWGVLLIHPHTRALQCLRAPRKHGSVRAVTVNNLVKQIGRAHQYRHMYHLGLLP